MAKGFLYDNGNELITREDVSEVPSGSAASAGDVLTLDTNKKPKWTTPESELPSTGSASEGDVLSLNASKEPVWSTPSGGLPIPLYLASNVGTSPSVAYSLYTIDSFGTPLSISDILGDSDETDFLVEIEGIVWRATAYNDEVDGVGINLSCYKLTVSGIDVYGSDYSAELSLSSTVFPMEKKGTLTFAQA